MISNSELSNRFDVLYNNITSSQAPGLDEYEKSVFWNKAQLEVLKNKLNPKGNKYGEGFDFSSKRQLEFSELTVTDSYDLFPQRSDGINSSAWLLCKTIMTQQDNPNNPPTWEVVPAAVNYHSMLAILNETIDVVDNKYDSYVSLAKTLMIGEAMSYDVNEDGKFSVLDLSAFIDLAIHGELPNHVAVIGVDVLRNALLENQEDGVFVLKNPKTGKEIVTEYNFSSSTLVVVPINNIEYDTLMSRPFKYPPKSQAWRLLSEDNSEVIVGPNLAPYRYNIRYIKTPREVEFHVENGNTCELPDFLIDEVLQRAVELAKAAYVGDMNHQQLIQAMGERSE